MIIRRLQKLLFAITLVLFAYPSFGQNADELAKQTQNPISTLISVPFQANWDMGIGDREATGTILNFQPVVPFGLTPKWNVILRSILPLQSQPDSSGIQRSNGLGDATVSLFLTRSAPGKIIWGVGPALLLPTATNSALGTEKFGLGPTFVVLAQPARWTIGLLANQIWSVDGAVDRADVSQLFLQPFAQYNLGDGLAVGVSTEASITWKSEGGASVPLLFSASKVTRLGSRPVNLQMAAGPMLAHPAGADWRFRMAIVFLFPR
jgi:hypothetical protein